MDRQIYKFRFSEMEQVVEAYNKYMRAMYSENKLLEADSEKIIDDVIRRTSADDVNRINSAAIKFASILVPIGLRLKPEEMENIEAIEAINYLYEILEVNKGFFIELRDMGLNIPEKMMTEEEKKNLVKIREEIKKKIKKMEKLKSGKE